MSRLIWHVLPLVIGAHFCVAIWMRAAQGRMRAWIWSAPRYLREEGLSGYLEMIGVAFLGAGLVGLVCSIGRAAFGNDFVFSPDDARRYIWERWGVTVGLMVVGVLMMQGARLL